MALTYSPFLFDHQCVILLY